MKTVLFIGAHPDDIEIGCGGTAAKLKKQGYKIIVVIATRGEQGSLHTKGKTLKKIRTKEAIEASKVLGAHTVLFLDLNDGLTNYTLESKIKLIKLIRKFKPKMIFTHSSQDHFPDHLIIHQLSLSAVLGAQGPWYEEAGGQPHYVETILGYEVWNPLNRFQMAIDISDTLAIKCAALAKHQSQIKDVDYTHAVKGLAAYRGATSMTGTYAEVFEVIKSKSL